MRSTIGKMGTFSTEEVKYIVASYVGDSWMKRYLISIGKTMPQLI